MRDNRAPSEGLRDRPPALILGKGITALASMRCLGRRGIPLYVAGTTDDLLTRSRWYRPLPGEGFDRDFRTGTSIRRLASLDIERMVLLPTSDKWATAVSRLRPDLATRFPSTVAPPEILQRLVDKSSFARALAELDVPHPRTSILREPGALRSLPAELFRNSFLKPTKSGPFAQEYGVKAVNFDNLEDAFRLFDEATAKGFELMLQEYIPGPASRHCFVEGFIDRDGRLCGMLARRRIRMYPKDFGNSTSTETIPLSEVSSAADSLTRLLRGIDYRGVFSAEFKHDERDGLFKILEVNARPWWFVGFAASCGIDVCDMAYRDALGEARRARFALPRSGAGASLPASISRPASPTGGRAASVSGRFFVPGSGPTSSTLCWDDPCSEPPGDLHLEQVAAEAQTGMVKPGLVARVLTEPEFPEWNDLVARSAEGSIYSTPEYLDALCASRRRELSHPRRAQG